MLVALGLLIIAGALAQLVRHTRDDPPAPPRRALGWLDDDGQPRGERWDGSPFSAPRAASSPA